MRELVEPQGECELIEGDVELVEELVKAEVLGKPLVAEVGALVNLWLRGRL
jgi:hypothetical protein